MAKSIVDIADFHARLARGHKPKVGVRLAPSAETAMSSDERVMTFVFSDKSVDRYGDTIDARGWVLDNFNANPVALFGHDASNVDNVIGKARNVRVEADRLVGEIEFASAEVNPKAETVYQLVKGGFLNAVSVGFQPLEWSLSKDKSRPGGVDFRKQELLEISIVPIPALPSALVLAKAAGIDIQSLGLVSVKTPTKKGLYEVSWLAQLLAELSYLEDCVEWEAEYEGDSSEVPQKLTDALRLLGETLVAMTVEEVAELLAEEDGEDATDGQKAVRALIKTGVPMLGVSQPKRKFIVHANEALSDVKAARILAAVKTWAETDGAVIVIEEGRSLTIVDEDVVTLTGPVQGRAGKRISSDTETQLRGAVDLMTQAAATVSGVLEIKDDDPAPTDVPNDAMAKAARKRRAAALKLRAALPA